MDLSDLIQVVPLALSTKKNKKQIKTSSVSSSSCRIIKQKKCKKKIKQSNKTENDEKTSIIYSDNAIKSFQQKAMRRLHAKSQNIHKMGQNQAKSTQSLKIKRFNDEKNAQLAMENAKKRINKKKMKMEEEKERISEEIAMEKTNYIKRKQQRKAAKIAEQQKRARIYFLNYLFKKKHDLMCHPISDK